MEGCSKQRSNLDALDHLGGLLEILPVPLDGFGHPLLEGVAGLPAQVAAGAARARAEQVKP